MTDLKPCLPYKCRWSGTTLIHAPACPNSEASKVVEDDYCGCEPGTYCNNHNPAPAPEDNLQAALVLERNRYKSEALAIRAELAQAKEERDQFETESEQKGADLMGCEGALKEAEARVRELEDLLVNFSHTVRGHEIVFERGHSSKWAAATKAIAAEGAAILARHKESSK